MKHKVLVSLLSLTLLSSGALAGCKKNTNPSSESTSAFDKYNPVSTANKDGKTITLSQTALTLSIGKTSVLATTLSDGFSGAITWGSSDDAVATVAANGKVTAIAGGVCKISAYLDGAAAVCDVTVVSGTIAFSGESTLEVGAELLIQPTVTSGLKDHTMNFAFPADKATEYGAIVTLPTKVTGLVGITVKGKAEGTVKLHASMTADENVGIDITITVIAAKPTVSQFFEGFTAKNYTIESKLVSEDDFDDDSFDVKTAESAKVKTASGENGYVYNGKRTEKAITSQHNGSDIWKKAGIAVDKNGNAGYLLRDATSGAITADPAGRMVSDNGFVGVNDFDGDKKTFSTSPLFEGINAINPDWASNIEKADDNTYDIAFAPAGSSLTDAEYLDFELVYTLWNIFDPVGSTSITGDSITLANVAKSVNITLKIVDDKDIIVKLSSDAITLGTDTKYRVMGYIKDIGTTAQAADFAAVAGNADLEFALPTLNADVQLAKQYFDNHDDYISVNALNSGVKDTSGHTIYVDYNDYITKDYLFVGDYNAAVRADYKAQTKADFPAAKYGTVYYVNSTDHKVHVASVDSSAVPYTIVSGTDKLATAKDGTQFTWNDGGSYDFYQANNFGYSHFSTDNSGVNWYLLSSDLQACPFDQSATAIAMYHSTEAIAALNSMSMDVGFSDLSAMGTYLLPKIPGLADVATGMSGGWLGMTVTKNTDATSGDVTSLNVTIGITPIFAPGYGVPGGAFQFEYNNIGDAKCADLETALGTTYVKHAA
jgi:hypothetical protein